jgi:hypothetical protein
MDVNLVKVAGAAQPSGIPVITAQGGKNNDGGRSGGYRGFRSRGSGKKKKSRPRPYDLRNCPRYLKV